MRVPSQKPPLIKISLLLLALSPLSRVARGAPPPRHHHRQATERCEADLNVSRLQSLKTAFAHGLDDDDATVGYVGISQGMMRRLSEATRVRAPVDFLSAPLHLTSEHPDGAKTTDRPSSDRKTAIAAAARDARHRAAFELVQSRLLNAGFQLPAEAHRPLYEVIRHLDAVGFSPRRAWLYSPDFDDILSAFARADISGPASAKKSRAEFSARAKANHIFSHRPVRRRQSEKALAYEKLTLFSRWIGFPAASLRFENSRARERFLQLFAGLPTRAGYVLGVRPSFVRLGKQVLDPEVLKIGAKDIAGIEPMGHDEFHYMENL